MASRDFWAANARRLMMRRNLAAYLDVFLPALLYVSGAAAVIVLLLRTLNIALVALWWCFAAALVIAAVGSWLAARAKFFGTKQALVQLDAVGQMHNRLTAAAAGIGEWPPPRDVRDPTRWRWLRLGGPPALSALLIVGAACLPIPRMQERQRVVEPIAWSQLESWVQTLEESKLVEQAALDQLREQLNGLRDQPPEAWYNQSSLEAGDTLRERTEQALRGLLDNLQKTDETIAAAGATNEKSPPAQLQALNESLQAAVRGLEMGNLPLNKDLLGELKKLDAAKAKQLSPSQLSEMRAKVQSGVRTAEQCVSPGANVKKSLALGEEPGGTGGGGGPAPLALNPQPTDLRTKETETIANDDTSQALPTDLVGVQSGEHSVEKVDRLPQVAGGPVASRGEGGEAVRRETFTPQERGVLQRYFK